MLKLFDDHHDHKPRTRYFLTTGGRVVRVYHDPDAGNRLIVPTEDELKTILYDQTNARSKGNGHRRRHNIDFVALHANRRPRRKGSKNGVGNNQRTYENNCSPVVGNGEEFCLSDRPHIRRERGVKSDWCLRLKANRQSSKHHDSGEEDDVSLFLESFSASEMPGQHPAAAVETAVTRQSPPTSLCPDNGLLEGKARKAEAVVVDTTQTTLEMSKPLAKIDLYSILAKAPPAEPRSTASHRPVGGFGWRVDPTMSNKAGMKPHKREQGSLRRLASSVVVGGDERPAFETALRLTPREEVGGYLKRDPLGDEVAELNAKLQESLRRVTQDTQRHKRTQPVGVARHYAAVLGDRTRPLNIAKRLPTHGRDEDNIDGNDDTDATSSHDSRRCRATTDDRDYGRAADVFQHSCRRDRGRIEDSAKSNRTSSSTRISTRHSSGKGADSETSPTTGGRDSTSGAGLEVGRDGVRWLPDDEAELHSLVTGPPIGCRGNHDLQAPQQEQQPPDDVLDPGTTNSDYGEEPVESANGAPESVSGSMAVAPSVVTTEGGVSGMNLDVAMENKAGRNNGDGVISEREDYSSGHEATGEDGVLLSKDGAAPSSATAASAAAAAASAAALRIEACWRGFVGRCVAKRLLRFRLLDALRSIGGGKVSKVVSLTDVEREDRRGLNRALRLATQSRRQLPPQVLE
ncbi:unnamed protein product [Ectocarpus sp. 12 AP-2014]